ncbi:protein TolR [Acetobacteraceae bacterium]|nr:protein TolR [Acetobacteraceae bacterium]
MAIRRTRKKKKFETAINVTPLVDVMLVLLIIFMVTAPMMTTGVNVDLPKASATPINTDSKPITVSLKNDGSVFVGDNPVTLENIVPTLQQASHGDTAHRIFVRADAKIDYGRVMGLMGKVTSAGFTHVALLAQQPPTS